MTNDKNIPVLKPLLPTSGQLLPFLEEIDNNQWYTNFGPLYQKFLQQLNKQFPQSTIALTSSGTSALELALQALNLKRGSTVLLPALTFPATVIAVIKAGLRPVISDIDPETWQLTPTIATELISYHKIDAIMPVATFGVPVDEAEWDIFCEKSNLPVVIDAAGAFGNQRVGKFCHTVFSLHATKAFSAGEGGMVVSANAQFGNCIIRASNFGINANGLVDGLTLGTNAKLSEFHAAVGLASLQLWPSQMQQRLELLTQYQTQIENCNLDIELQSGISKQCLSLLNFKFPAEVDVEVLSKRLNQLGIETRRWYYPLIPNHPNFSGTKVLGDLNIANNVSKTLLGVPFHLGLERRDVTTVCETIRDQIKLF